MNLSIVSRAVAYAVAAFGDKADHSGHLAVFHLIRVAAEGETETQQVLGALHDVVEDTDKTLSDIAASFGTDYARKVDLLTRREFETYAQYIQRIVASRDIDVITTKLKDATDNYHRCLGHFRSTANVALAGSRYWPTIQKLQAVLFDIEA